MRYFKGFTLIELLVAVSIMAILGAIGFSVFNSVFSGNRDGQRWRDLQTIKQAVELYRNDNHYYPASLKNGLVSKYLDKVPSDPKSGNNWQYGYSAYTNTGIICNLDKDCISFVLCAGKEGNSDYNLPDLCVDPVKGPICKNNPGDCNMGVPSD